MRFPSQSLQQNIDSFPRKRQGKFLALLNVIAKERWQNNSHHLTRSIPFLFRCKSLYPESFRDADFTPHKTCLR